MEPGHSPRTSPAAAGPAVILEDESEGRGEAWRGLAGVASRCGARRGRGWPG